MPTDRYFSHSNILADAEHHHLSHVMRHKVNDTIELINGKGSLSKATIQSINTKETSLKILSTIQEPPPKYPLILIQAIPRQNRLDTICEKATELGATHIQLYFSRKSESKKPNLARLEKILIAAIKQSGRLYLPTLSIENTLPKIPTLFADPDGKPLPFLVKPGSLAILIGPESGFTHEEKKAFLDQGIQPAKLNEHILRTDTAAISALSIIQAVLLN